MRRSRTDPLRLAIISTPRAGNNWLQNLLSRAYDLPRLSPVSLPNVDWMGLPRDCVLILHWRRDPALVELLHTHRFRVISLARHPLAVLVSILHFALREPTGWLHDDGAEQAILGLSPASPGFLDYACGPRAAALLAVTCDWWRAPGCLRVRYEDLLADPEEELRRLVDAIGVPPRRPVHEAAAAVTLAGLRAQHPERPHHFWQGRPDLWKTLLPAAAAHKIAAAHPTAFAPLGYGGDPDPDLTDAQADANWRSLLGLPTDNNAPVDVLQKVLEDVKIELRQTRARLAALAQVGPLTLSLAQRWRQWSNRFPRLAGAVKCIFGRAPNLDGHA
ncbi:MAG: sulfotransferase domain-containing protein [Gemmataceae bacterium]